MSMGHSQARIKLPGDLGRRLLLPYHHASLSGAYIDKLADTVFSGLERKSRRSTTLKPRRPWQEEVYQCPFSS